MTDSGLNSSESFFLGVMGLVFILIVFLPVLLAIGSSIVAGLRLFKAIGRVEKSNGVVQAWSQFAVPLLVFLGSNGAIFGQFFLPFRPFSPRVVLLVVGTFGSVWVYCMTKLDRKVDNE